MTNATDTNKTLGESMFAQCGYAQDAIDKRVSQVWHEIFEGPNKFYWENDEGLAYVMDTGNNDVRTEGMSYAMMIALQYDRKDVFDKLWGWVMRHMYMKDGHHAHYFAWSVATDGTPNSNGPAPDGEEYFAMDLFLASRRWGDGEDIYEYSAWGREILRYCVHKGERYDGEPMWNPDNKLIKFIPETEWSDPSYHLPHFYELFALWANKEDREFWRQAAQASRTYLHCACHPDTGLSPEYGEYNGEPHTGHVEQFGRHDWYYSDAYRTIANIGLDTLWFGKDPWQKEIAQTFQEFYCVKQKGHWDGVFLIDGTRLEEKALHPVAVVAVNAQASLAADGAYSRECVEKFWNTPLRTGDRRYYDNFLYLFALMALSGNYRIWK